MLWLVALLMTSVGVGAGFVLGKRASNWCPGCGQTVPSLTPRPFALHAIKGSDPADNAGPARPLLAWGMALPDGSAITVGWRNGPSSGVAICASPDQAARLHDADLVWLPWSTRAPA
jgi:hypothetical protein